MATRIHASPVSGSASSSWLSRRFRPNQANVRSTIQRLGSTANVVAPADFLISPTTPPPVTHAQTGRPPA